MVIIMMVLQWKIKLEKLGQVYKGLMADFIIL